MCDLSDFYGERVAYRFLYPRPSRWRRALATAGGVVLYVAALLSLVVLMLLAYAPAHP